MWLHKTKYWGKLIVVFSFLGLSIWFFSPQPASAFDQEPSGQHWSHDSGQHESHVSGKDTIKKFWYDDYGQTHREGDAEDTCRMEFEWDLLAKAKPDECFYGPFDPAKNLASFVYPGNLTKPEKKLSASGQWSAQGESGLCLGRRRGHPASARRNSHRPGWRCRSGCPSGSCCPVR